MGSYSTVFHSYTLYKHCSSKKFDTSNGFYPIATFLFGKEARSVTQKLSCDIVLNLYPVYNKK